MNIKPVLKENDWSTIIEVANKGEGQNYWRIGDEIDLTLSGTFNETATLQIWDFDHYDKSDGTGKAHILFGMKHLMKKREYMNTFYFSIGEWNKSYMKNTVMKNIYESIPGYIRNHIKEVYTYASPGGGYLLGKGLLSKDKVFIPGLTEADDNWTTQNQTEIGQKKFPIFSNNSSRTKRLNNGSGAPEYWWTRSPYYYSSNYFCYFSTDGYNTGTCVGFAGNDHGVCFCFNI